MNAGNVLPERKLVDCLIMRHQTAYSYHKEDDFYKTRHNILVLTYITSKPIGKREVCNRLGLKDHVYNKNLEKGIDELMVYLFGIDGVKWK